MPPRRSAQLSATDVLNGGTLVALPPVLQRAVLTRLPVDAKAHAACVCRAWDAALREPSLWQDLDLSSSSGVLYRTSVAMLEAAAARAGGSLRTLIVDGLVGLTHEALLAVVNSNAGSLLELCMRGAASDAAHFEALLLAGAPGLRISEARLACDEPALACRVLRGEGTFRRLRLQGLKLNGRTVAATQEDSLALAAAISSHPSLTIWFLLLCRLKPPRWSMRLRTLRCSI